MESIIFFRFFLMVTGVVNVKFYLYFVGCFDCDKLRKYFRLINNSLEVILVCTYQNDFFKLNKKKM